MYRSVLCHLHSSFEGPASISGYCHAAREVGVDAIWLSDHDSMIPGVTGIEKRFPFYEFGASDPFTPVVDSVGRPQGDYWQLKDVNDPDSWNAENAADGSALVLQTQSAGDTFRGASLRLFTRGKAHHRSLLSRPTFTIELEGIESLGPDARLSVIFHVSQTPPEYGRGFFTYVLGGEGAKGLELPLQVKDGKAQMVMAEDTQRLGLGLDHTTRHIDIRLEGRRGQKAEVRLKRFSLDTEIVDADELARLQLELGRQIGSQYGIDVLVGTEISAGREHRTCFGAAVPFFPYSEWPARPPQDVLNRHVEEYGGITSINHSFAHLKRDELTEAERMAAVEEKAEELIAQKGYGSKMIEVGLPQGRHGFDLYHYLLLWDKINLGGVRIYGIGVSDAHSNVSWEKGNNYANYVASPDTSPENLTAGMRAGRFYMADPQRLRGQVDFRSDQGKTMGDTQTGGYVELSFSAAPEGAEVTWVLDGEACSVEKVQGYGKSRFCIDDGKHFVRAEMRDAEGRMILLTNPLWIGE